MIVYDISNCPEQIKNCINFFHKIILGVTNANDDVSVWVAGGAIRNYLSGVSVKKDDIDLFFPNSQRKLG